MNGFSEPTIRLIASLREEARQVTSGFTQYSIQTIAFATTVFGASAALQKSAYEYAGLAAIPVIILVLTVVRIGTHTYATSNRLSGYILFLEYAARFGSKNRLRLNGWEEAMRAWRAVQSTVFDKLYVNKGWHRDRLQHDLQNDRMDKRRWFLPKTLLRNGAIWYSGSYLENVLRALHIIAFLGIAQLGYLTYQLRDKWSAANLKSGVTDNNFAALVPIVFAASILYFYFRRRKTRDRRELLENGLLSINSCALMWHAIAVAHYRTLVTLRNEDLAGGIETPKRGYYDYTNCLSWFAIDLCNKLDREAFHDWLIEEKDDEIIRAAICGRKKGPKSVPLGTPSPPLSLWQRFNRLIASLLRPQS